MPSVTAVGHKVFGLKPNDAMDFQEQLQSAARVPKEGK
jgi:hypothetical protein